MAQDGWPPVAAWVITAAAFVRFALWRGVRVLAVDRNAGSVSLPGSAVPLLRNVIVFALQYAVAVIGAIKLDAGSAAVMFGHAVSGACAGYFFGWAVAMLRRYRAADADRPEA